MQKNKYNFENMPSEMKLLNRWVCWKAVDRNGNITKSPFQPNGFPAASNDENTWSSFETVVSAYEQGNEFDGIGFFLGAGIIGIDIDKCLDSNGNPNETALDVIKSVDSFKEISVSGTGIHFFVKGEKPKNIEFMKKNSKFDIELYDSVRFFAVTGNTEDAKPLKDDQKGLETVLYKYFIKNKSKKVSYIPQRRDSNMSNSELWNKMFSSKNGQVIKALYDGQLINGDHSSSDIALCNHLAFWTNKDASQMDSMFRESALIRDKWDRKTGDSTYGKITINKAISDTATVLADFQPHNEPKKEFDWKSKLEYGVTKNGDRHLLKNARNCELILENCLADKLAYDEFSLTEVVKKNLPWRKTVIHDEWKDADISQLLHWFDAKWDMSGKDKILNAFVHVIHKRSFHPIKDYLESAVWDGEIRVPYLFHNFLGAENTDFNHEISIRWFIGAIKRIYEPGCKHDWGIVLVGPKDIGKSWIIRKISPYSSFGELTDFDAKRGGEQLRGKWILEIPELSAKKKSNNEEMKAFMSRQSDDYRASYARKTETRPRQCVFIGTTNKMEFITDETGDRRNVPIICHKEKIKMDISTELSSDYIFQLWAEAKFYFDKGKESHLDKQLAEKLDEVNAIHMTSDPLQDEVLAYAEKIHESGRNHLCVREIWDNVITDDTKKKPTRKDSERIIVILTMLRYEKAPKKQRCGDYGPREAYIKSTLATKATH